MTEGANGVIKLVKQYWPKYKIIRDNILRPTTVFVTMFYSDYLQEISEIVFQFTNEQLVFNEVVDLLNFDTEVLVYYRISKILALYNSCGKFTLNDIYNPQTKRTNTFITLCMHSLIFFSNKINNCSSNIIQEEEQKKNQAEDLIRKKQSHLETIEKNAQLIAELHKYLTSELQEAKKKITPKFEDLKEIAVSKKNIYDKKERKIDHLNVIYKNLEYKFEKIQSEHANLQEKVVIESEYDNYIHILKSLEMEAENLNSYDDNMEHGLKVEKQQLEHTEQCTRLLNSLHFDTFEELTVLEEQLKTLINEKNELYLQLNDLNSVKEKFEIEDNCISQKFTSIQQNCCSNIKNKRFILDKLNEEYTDSIKMYKTKEQDQLNQVDVLKNEIGDTQTSINLLKENFAFKYLEVLKWEKNAVIKFSSGLKMVHEKMSELNNTGQ